MEAEFVNIFQTLAYPVAVSVVLFLAFGFFAKKMLDDVRKRDDEAVKMRDQFIAYLQSNNTEITQALKESAGAIKENASALNRFAIVLEKFENIIRNNKI